MEKKLQQKINEEAVEVENEEKTRIRVLNRLMVSKKFFKSFHRIRSTTKSGINRYRARTPGGATVFGRQQPNTLRQDLTRMYLSRARTLRLPVSKPIPTLINPTLFSAIR